MNATRLRMGFVALLLAAVLAAVGAAGPWSPGARDEQSDRLERLSPERPVDYFELAEELSDAPRNDADRDMARRLFALAGTIDPRRYGRSAAIALVPLARTDLDRRRLLALAELLDDGAADFLPGDDSAASAAGDEARLAVCEALSAYRRGQGQMTLNLLDTPGAMPLLERHGALLPGGVTRLLANCRIYRGTMTPTFSEQEVTGMLQLQLVVLGGDGWSWSSDLGARGGRPLVIVERDELAMIMGIDPAQTIWRGGRWTAPAASERTSSD